MDVSRGERSDDQKPRQYERHSAGPCPQNPPQPRDEKAISPLLGKKAKKSGAMCDIGHTRKNLSALTDLALRAFCATAISRSGWAWCAARRTSTTLREMQMPPSSARPSSCGATLTPRIHC